MNLCKNSNQPIAVIVEGMVTDFREEGTASPFPSNIENMDTPIIVSPLTKVTLLRDEQSRNALSPKCNNHIQDIV